MTNPRDSLDRSAARQADEDGGSPTNGEPGFMRYRNGHRISWRVWLAEKFDWSWFTCTQSTGGVAILLSECPKKFHNQDTAGIVLFILNLVLWATFVCLMVTRWLTSPYTLRKSFTDAPECFYFGTFWLSAATIIICMQLLGTPHAGPWLVVAIRVCFWIYAACTLLSAVATILLVSRFTPIRAIDMNPAWFIMIYCAMLTGTVAAAIAMGQPPGQRVPIIVAGVAFQGYGWLGSLVLVPWYIGHLLEKGWPPASQSPGMFMPVGAAGFTVVALIGNARATPAGFEYFGVYPTAHDVLLIVATWAGIFLWVFALFLFGLALVAIVSSAATWKNGKWVLPMSFNNTFWAVIFPNVGFTLATIYIGEELQSQGIQWVSVAMVILLFALWVFDLVLMAKTIILSLFKDSRYSFL